MWRVALITCTAAAVAAASTVVTGGGEAAEAPGAASYHVPKVASFQRGSRESSYQYVWPPLEFGWRIVVGSIIGFLGSALGTVGGVGGGGIYVPMLTLIIGFDAKSSAAISKCMIMSAAGSTVWYNLKLRHPTLDMPIIDYDLALLFQPMLMLGISIGVAFSVILADWMVTVLLIIVFIMASTKATSKGIHAWKKETIEKKEEAMLRESNESAVIDYTALPSGPPNLSISRTPRKEVEIEMCNNIIIWVGSKLHKLTIPTTQASILENVYWKELGLLCFVWVTFLLVQVVKENYTATCSLWYWILNLIQVPVSVGISGYEAVCLYRGKRRIASKGEEGTNFTVFQLVSYCTIGCLAGVVAGLLGLGGGFILGPLFLELNIPPQVSGATATFTMTFSSSMSVIEYYLLKRFPVPFALYFVGVALAAAFVGQHVVKRIVEVIGRASLLIFILSFTIFVSAISLGGAGISNIVAKIENHDYMGFESLCKYKA